ncbi:MAG: hypothetical protein KGM47_13910 [Acidobacteriota bacterium]|nr:hypothetical protein [Acidobacteriota bacterium]
MKCLKFIPVLALVIALAPLEIRATGTEFWQIGTFAGFLQGTLQGVSASMNGNIMLAPETEPVFNPNETVALSVAADGRGNLYVGTGHQGKVFVVNQKGEGRLLFQAPEPEILALAIGPSGDLFAASSPEGKIYRIDAGGKSSVFYNPKVKYIWSLAFDSEGRLYAGTGDRGEILRIGQDGKGRVFFSSNQTHIMCLAFDKDGNLLAGSDPSGLVYRITPQGKAFVLYKSELPEIHSLASDSTGRIYVAALGNAMPGGVPAFFPSSAAPRPVIHGEATSVTVVASANSVDGADQAREQTQVRTPSIRSEIAPERIETPFAHGEQGRGALVEILPDYTAQTLWTSNKESIFGLATHGGDILFSTGDNGRIFDLEPSPSGVILTLLTETRESLPTRILADKAGIYVATSNVAKLIRIGSSLGTAGSYLSPVKDTRFVSRWGRISWRASVPSGCSLKFYARSGNSARPDSTWTDWTGPYGNSEGNPITATPARFVQWKAVFQGTGGKTPSLSEVEIGYLNQNLPPEIRSLTINDGSERTSITGTPLASPGNFDGVTPVATVTTATVSPLEYLPETPGADPGGKLPIVISWVATDPNQDHLIYSLYLKSAGEQDWHLLKDKLMTTNYSIEPDSLADGEYRARLVASDSPSNPPGKALTAALESAPFWVDNTPPLVRVVGEEVNGHSAVVHFEATSKAAPLRRAQVSEAPNMWNDIISNDGIIDSRDERFTVRIGDLASGEHVVSLRAYDTSGNVGIGAAVIHIQ